MRRMRFTSGPRVRSRERGRCYLPGRGACTDGAGGILPPMAPRDRPPFRADNVGSLLRPRADHAEGRIDAGALRAVEDDAVREAVAMQRDAGLRSVTDGEFRRASWHMDFIYQLGGVSQVEGERIHVK